MQAANIQCWIETHWKMKWRLAMRIASHSEARVDKKTAIWNPGLSTKADGRVGRPNKRWEEDSNQFVRSDETEETRGNDLKNNDIWLKAATDQKTWKDVENTFINIHKAASPNNKHSPTTTPLSTARDDQRTSYARADEQVLQFTCGNAYE